MKMQTTPIRFEDSDPWYIRYQTVIGVPVMGLLLGVLIMLPFFI